MTIDLDRLSNDDLLQEQEKTESQLGAINEIRNLLIDAIGIAKKEADDGAMFERLLDILTEVDEDTADMLRELDIYQHTLREEAEIRERVYETTEEDTYYD